MHFESAWLWKWCRNLDSSCRHVHWGGNWRQNITKRHTGLFPSPTVYEYIHFGFNPVHFDTHYYTNGACMLLVVPDQVTKVHNLCEDCERARRWSHLQKPGQSSGCDCQIYHFRKSLPILPSPKWLQIVFENLANTWLYTEVYVVPSFFFVQGPLLLAGF